MLSSFILASLISAALIIASVIIFYEILAHVWIFLPRIDGKPRTQILVSILAAFVGHTAVIWLFGLTYYAISNYTGFGALGGIKDHAFLDYIYFSGVAYSSLGFGDIYPTGDMRLMIAVEAILGLVLIGWTITITYFATERYLIHKRERHGRRHS
jgi:hypothetical protein